MPLPRGLAEWLRIAEHDAEHASDVGLSRSADCDIMAYADLQQRTVVTADLDYPRLLALTGADGPSVILFRGGDWSDTEVIARMNDVLARFAEDEIVQSILVIQRDRMRRRRLPIG